jgi:hypothetical protein
VYLSDYSTEFFISWPKNMPDVPNVHARQTRDFRDASTINTGDGAADGIAGLAINPVRVFRTSLLLYVEFLRLWTSFELSSSWRRLPCYGASTNRSGFCVMG